MSNLKVISAYRLHNLKVISAYQLHHAGTSRDTGIQGCEALYLSKEFGASVDSTESGRGCPRDASLKEQGQAQ